MQHLRKGNAFVRALSVLLAVMMILPLGITVNAAASDWIDGTGYPTIDGLTIQTSKAYPMTYSGGEFASTNKGQGSKTSGVKVTPTEACILSFEAKVSSENNWDGLRYGTTEMVNSDSGSVIDRKGFSGDKDWTSFSVALSAGQSLYIVYYKDGSGNGGSDTMWLRNFSAEAPEFCSVSASSEDTSKGSVAITSGVSDGQAVKTGSVTVKATPASGFRFNGWYNGENRVSTSTTYTFTVSADVDLVAKFDAKVKDLSATYHVPEHASATYKVTREGSAYVAAGTALPADGVISGLWQDDKVEITLTPESGDYVFSGWYTDSAFTTGNDSTQNISKTIGTSSIEYWCKIVYDGWVAIDHEYDGISSIETRAMYPFVSDENGTLVSNLPSQSTVSRSASVIRINIERDGYLRVYYSQNIGSASTASTWVIYNGTEELKGSALPSQYTTSLKGKTMLSDRNCTDIPKYVEVHAGDTIYYGYGKYTSSTYPYFATLDRIAVVDEIPKVNVNISYDSTMAKAPVIKVWPGTNEYPEKYTGNCQVTLDSVIEITSESKDTSKYVPAGFYKLVDGERVLDPYCAIYSTSNAFSTSNRLRVTGDVDYESKFVDKADASWDMNIHVPEGAVLKYYKGTTAAASNFVTQTPDENGVVTIHVTTGDAFALIGEVTDPETSFGGFYQDSALTSKAGLTYYSSQNSYYANISMMYAPDMQYGNEIWMRIISYESVPGFEEPAEGSGIASIKIKTDDYPWTLQEDGSLRSANINTEKTISQMKVTAEATGLLAFDVKMFADRSTLNSSLRVLDQPITISNYQNSLNKVTAETWKGSENPVFVGGENHFTGEVDWETAYIPMQAGETYYFAFVMNNLNNSAAYRDNYAYLRNFRIIESTVNCQVDYESNYGEVFMENATQGTAALGYTAKFRAVPKVDGTKVVGQFFRWEDGSGNVLSYDPEYSFRVTEDIHLVARFIAAPSGNAFLSYRGLLFDSIDTAFAFAQANPAPVDVTERNPQGNPSPVVLLESRTFSSDITIPNGVVFLVPYSDDDYGVTVRNEYGRSPEFPYANTDFYRHTSGDKVVTDSHPAITYPEDEVFRTVTLENGASINVGEGAAFIVGGKFSGGQPIGGGTYGAHSNVVLGANSHVNVTDGGVFSTFGYILGEGTVELTGGTVYEPFIVTDFHGGEYTGAQYLNGTTPFGSYAMINVQTDLTMDSDSSIVGYCSLYAMSTQNKTHVTMIGPDGAAAMFNLFSGTLTTHYDPDTVYKVKGRNNELFEFGQKTLDIDGNAAVSMRLMEMVPVTTANVAFPVPCNIKVVVEPERVLDIPITRVVEYQQIGDPENYEYEEVVVDAQIIMALLPGTEVWIKEGAALNISGGLYVLDGMAAKKYSADTAYGSSLDTSVFSDRAHLVVDGELTVYEDGMLAGIVETNGTGYVYADSGAVLSGTYYDGVLKGWSALSSTTKTNRTGYPLTAQLLDAATGELIDIEEDVEYFGFDKGSKTLTSFEYTEFTGDKDNYSEDPATPGTLVNATINGSWNTDETETYTVSWQNYDGTVLETDEGVAYEDAVSYDGATPLKPDDDDNSFNFSGWDGGVATYPNGELVVVYTAQYDELGKLFTGHNITLNGDVDLNFFVSTGDNVPAGSTVTFTWDVDTEDGVVHKDKAPITLTSDDVTENGHKVNIALPAAEMTYPITATLKDADGEVLSVNTFSVRDYALAILDDSNSSDELKQLVKTMLDYGAKAQIVFDRNVDTLANEGVDYTMPAADAAMVEEAVNNCPANAGKSASSFVSGTDDAYGVRYYGTSLVYLSGCSLRQYYTVCDQGAFQYYKDQFNGSKAPYYYLEKPEIPAAELDVLQEFVVGENHYFYSALNFIKAVMEKYSVDDANYQLASATYWYNQAANAYFGQ